MASARQTASRMRQRKLNIRQGLQVLREDEVENAEGSEAVPKVASGVEAHEETEHHLQAAISAANALTTGGHVAQIYIPTPDAVQISTPYKDLYSLKFSQPATYIRFSSTVEDCTGNQYNLVEEDDVWLKSYNERLAVQNAGRKNAPTRCSEDDLELVMGFLEEAARTQQPFTGLGEAIPVLRWDDIVAAFDENVDATNPFVKDVYEQHWRVRREKVDNQPLQAGLKIKILDTANDADDSDPYVCFRRREIRQVRKTRGRDAQSVEKLKRLRKELEEARNLVALVRKRELLKKDSLVVDKQMFEQRVNLRGLKRSLPEHFKEGDEELLVNQKPKKEKATDKSSALKTIAAPMRPPGRPDVRPGAPAPESELLQLSDWLVNKQQEIDRQIKEKVAQHKRWNEGHVDFTLAPLLPPTDDKLNQYFVSAQINNSLPTPPLSASDENGNLEPPSPDKMLEDKENEYRGRYSPPPEDTMLSSCSFRRRIGRGGRVIIDRRPTGIIDKTDFTAAMLDRFKFDQDDDDDFMLPSTPLVMDRWSSANMKYRALVSVPQQSYLNSAKRNVNQAAYAANAAIQNQAQQGVSGSVPSNVPNGTGPSNLSVNNPNRSSPAIVRVQS